MTTTLTDKQLADAYFSMEPGNDYTLTDHVAPGLRAVADLSITQADSEIHGLTVELDRVRLALTEAQRK